MKARCAGTYKGIVDRLRGAALNRQENDVRIAILQAFATGGKAPRVQEVAHAVGLPLAPVLEACRMLAAHDLIVWKDDEAQIVSAYPFSGVPTAHRVLVEGNAMLYAMCAIDALGIPFMLGQGAHIRSACFLCHRPVTVDISDGLLQGADPPTTTVWLSARDGCCVAEARCPLMNFLCDEGHLHAWLMTSPHEPGTRLTLMEALAVGKAAFGELLG